jgi:hypothetical protein
MEKFLFVCAPMAPFLGACLFSHAQTMLKLRGRARDGRHSALPLSPPCAYR